MDVAGWGRGVGGALVRGAEGGGGLVRGDEGGEGLSGERLVRGNEEGVGCGAECGGGNEERRGVGTRRGGGVWGRGLVRGIEERASRDQHGGWAGAVSGGV